MSVLDRLADWSNRSVEQTIEQIVRMKNWKLPSKELATRMEVEAFGDILMEENLSLIWKSVWYLVIKKH